ncbi:MAG: CBS domain-containing protein [Desulfuromonas sp.]|nr:CBS domain-containing protein [Desulfuromonas sp.]
MNIGELCTRNTVIVSPETSILAVAKLMRNQHVGDVVVVEERQAGKVPVGIITDRDIVVELLAKEVDIDKVCAGDLMSHELSVVNELDGVFETIELMRNLGVRRMPVVDDTGVLAGILAVDDLLELQAEQLTDMALLFSNARLKEREMRK